MYRLDQLIIVDSLTGLKMMWASRKKKLGRPSKKSSSSTLFSHTHICSCGESFQHRTAQQRCQANHDVPMDTLSQEFSEEVQQPPRKKTKSHKSDDFKQSHSQLQPSGTSNSTMPDSNSEPANPQGNLHPSGTSNINLPL